MEKTPTALLTKQTLKFWPNCFSDSMNEILDKRGLVNRRVPCVPCTSSKRYTNDRVNNRNLNYNNGTRKPICNARIARNSVFILFAHVDTSSVINQSINYIPICNMYIKIIAYNSSANLSKIIALGPLQLSAVTKILLNKIYIFLYRSDGAKVSL